MSDAPEISVVVATRNRAAILARTLEAMAELASPPGGWELIVVDNDSSDSTPRVCQSSAARLPIRRVVERRKGQSIARNTGIAATRGQWVVFADDDIIPAPTWLCVWSEAAARWPDAAGFGGPVTPLLPAGAPAWLADGRFASYAFARVDLGRDEMPYAWPLTPVAGNLVLRGRLVREQYQWNPRLGPRGRRRVSGSEVELLGRIMRDGHGIVYIPAGRVRHCIQLHQTHWPYLLRRAWANGRGTAEVMARGELPTVLGFKRMLVGVVLRDVARLAADIFLRGLALEPATEVARHLSELLARRRLDRRGAAGAEQEA